LNPQDEFSPESGLNRLGGSDEQSLGRRAPVMECWSAAVAIERAVKNERPLVR